MKLVIDDLRSFPNGTPDVLYARTSGAGVALLRSVAGQTIDELWLDYDLGGDDTMRAVLIHLAEEAFYDRPYLIREVKVHTSNPAGRRSIIATCQRLGLQYLSVDALSRDLTAANTDGCSSGRN